MTNDQIPMTKDQAPSTKVSRRRRLFILATLFVLIGAGCLRGRLAATLPSSSTDEFASVEDLAFEQATSSIVATLLVDAKSGVTVRRAGKVFAGENKLQLSYGDEVEVTKGQAILSWPMTGVTRLEEGTRLALGAPTVNDGEDESFFVRLELTAGGIWTRLERLLGPGEVFQASGNNVVATVRGTAFSFAVTGDDVDVSAADHEVEIAREDSSTSTVRLKPGERFFAKLADLRVERGVSPEMLRRRFVRALSAAERQRPLFRLLLQKVRQEQMSRPLEPVFLPVKPQINRRLLERLTPEQRKRFLRRLRVSFERARLMEQRIVPNPLLPLPLQLLRPATATR